MKYLPLIWAGLWRKRLRTILTLLSIVVAFVLFGLLQGVDAGLAHISELQRLDRLFTMSKYGTALPIGYLSQVAAVPGVTLVAPQIQRAGYWREQKNGVGILATDERWFAAFPEATITKDQLETLKRTRTGAVINIACAELYGWKVGDRIPLVTTLAQKDGSKIWTFDILAVISMEGHESDRFIVANYSYLDEGRAEDKGTLANFVLRTDDPAHAVRIGQAIDALFVSSATPTRTFSEKFSGQSEQNATFNTTFFVKSVVGAAFFTLLSLTATTMMQSVRERTSEFAVLKTLGFSDAGVLAIVLAESTLLTVIGAVLGLTIAKFLMPLAKDTIGIAHIRPIVFVEGALAALLVALVSGALPALRAKRLSIVDALAGR